MLAKINNTGFTLLEVVVALVIMTIGALMLGDLVLSQKRLAQSLAVQDRMREFGDQFLQNTIGSIGEMGDLSIGRCMGRLYVNSEDKQDIRHFGTFDPDESSGCSLASIRTFAEKILTDPTVDPVYGDTLFLYGLGNELEQLRSYTYVLVVGIPEALDLSSFSSHGNFLPVPQTRASVDPSQWWNNSYVGYSAVQIRLLTFAKVPGSTQIIEKSSVVVLR